MDGQPLNLAASVKLDASGNGTAQLSPGIGQVWNLTAAAVSTSTAVLFPTCSIYVGATISPSTFVDATYTGNQDSTDRVNLYPLMFAETIFAVWAGGDPGAIATLSILGTLDNDTGGTG